MKKNLIYITAALSAAWLLTACGGTVKHSVEGAAELSEFTATSTAATVSAGAKASAATASNAAQAVSTGVNASAQGTAATSTAVGGSVKDALPITDESISKAARP